MALRFRLAQMLSLTVRPAALVYQTADHLINPLSSNIARQLVHGEMRLHGHVAPRSVLPNDRVGVAQGRFEELRTGIR